MYICAALILVTMIGCEKENNPQQVTTSAQYGSLSFIKDAVSSNFVQVTVYNQRRQYNPQQDDWSGNNYYRDSIEPGTYSVRLKASPLPAEIVENVLIVAGNTTAINPLTY